ncbi:MAG: SBBP repeat-containing protein [Planctomycetota bacterium]|jgi:hypothetical protein
MRKLLFTFAVILGGVFPPCEMAIAYRLPSYMKFGYDRVVDPFGNIFIVSGKCDSKRKCRYATAKYDRSGKQIWIREGQGMGRLHNYFAAIGVDALGNAYIVQRIPNRKSVRKRRGQRRVVEIWADCVITKYDGNGQEIWTTSFDTGKEDGIDPQGLAVGRNGDVFVTGTCARAAGDSHIDSDTDDMFEDDDDIRTKKYDRDGKLSWSVRYNGAEGNEDWPFDVFLDDKGNVYIAGTTDEGKGKGSHFVTLKYDASGTLLWARNYTPRKGVFSGAQSVVVDDRGNVYVMGSSMSRDQIRMELITIKYDLKGEKQWVASYSDNDKKFANPATITRDDESGIYVSGYISPSPWQDPNTLAHSNTTGENVVIKYNTAGKEEWVAKYEQPLSATGWIIDVRIDDKLNNYLIAQIKSEVVIVKHDSDGKQKWVRRFGNLVDFLKIFSEIYHKE